MNDDQRTTKAKTKTCPFCMMDDVPIEAMRCRHCAGDIRQHEMLHSKVCFVATATLGDEDHPALITLRQYRDTILIPRSYGRYLVRTYYAVGPSLAALLRQSAWLRQLSRRFIVEPLARYAKRRITRS